jgi:hypothetical protein
MHPCITSCQTHKALRREVSDMWLFLKILFWDLYDSRHISRDVVARQEDGRTEGVPYQLWDPPSNLSSRQNDLLGTAVHIRYGILSLRVVCERLCEMKACGLVVQFPSFRGNILSPSSASSTLNLEAAYSKTFLSIYLTARCQFQKTILFTGTGMRTVRSHMWMVNMINPSNPNGYYIHHILESCILTTECVSVWFSQ